MRTSPRHRRFVAAFAVAAVGITGATGLTGCGSQPDAEPPVASVDFSPRLVVLVGDDEVTAEAGPREGATEGGDDAAWTVPAGAVVALQVDAAEPRDVVITTVPAGEGDEVDGDPWVDAGTLEPGDRTVLGFSAPGLYRITATGDAGSAELLVRVAPRVA